MGSIANQIEYTNGYHLFVRFKRSELDEYDGTYEDFVKIVNPLWVSHKQNNSEIYRHFSQVDNAPIVIDSTIAW